ncbi:MAG: hypothetical protein K6357_07715 [Elusimicrobiota bacterium]
MNLNQYSNNILNLISYISLAAYLLWGVSVIKEDRETGKIKNSKILLAFKITGILIFANLINTVVGYYGKSSNYLNFIFYKQYMIHIFYSIIFSLVLWYGEIWPAGDSKFFIANILFLPLIRYDLKGFPNYIWITTLINIFVFSAFFSVFYYLKDNIALLKAGDNNAFKEIKEFYLNKIKKIKWNSPSALFSIFGILSIFAYKQMFNLILGRYVFNIFHRTDIFFFLMFFLWPKISQFLRTRLWKYIMILMYAIMILAVFVVSNPLQFIYDILLTAIKNTFKFGSIFFLGKIIFEQIIETHNTYYVTASDIKPGMVLSSNELEILRTNEVFKGLFDDMFKDGLNEEQVDALKKWMENHPDKNIKLKFVKARPFAEGIFLGCLFEIIFNINLVSLLK